MDQHEEFDAEREYKDGRESVAAAVRLAIWRIVGRHVNVMSEACDKTVDYSYPFISASAGDPQYDRGYIDGLVDAAREINDVLGENRMPPEKIVNIGRPRNRGEE